MAVLIPEDTNTILLFMKTINDILKYIPEDNNLSYMYIKSVMIEFRNGVRNPNNYLGKCIDSFFNNLQFCDSNNISSVMLTLIEDMTRSLTFYELIENGINNTKISNLLFNNKNISISNEMKFRQPTGLNIPLYTETNNPNIIKKIEINDRFEIINEIQVPTLSYAAEFFPHYTSLTSTINELLSKQKKCICITNLQNIGGLLYQIINNILLGIIFNKKQVDIIKENIILFNKSRISKCSKCSSKHLLYVTTYMLAHLNYNMPSNNEIISVDTNIGVIKVSSVNNMLNRVFKYNLRGGGNISIREGFQIPNTRTAIQHTGFLKLFSDINYNSISDIEKQLRDIYHMSPDKHSIPLYCALIKASVIIKYIIPMCLEECMK
jgi:hypothetical protein